MEISVIDIGATTVHLLKAEVAAGKLYKCMESRHFVRMGDAALASGMISSDAWHSARQGVESLLERAKEQPTEHLVATATSLVREATNGPAFRKELEQRYGLPVRVLSVSQEAKLAYRGVRSTLTGNDAVSVVDLGGGCVNFAMGRGDTCAITATLPLGAGRLSPAFAPNGSLSRGDAQALRSLVGRSLGAIANRIDEHGAGQLVFCSGHARAVREYAMRRSDLPGETGMLDFERARAACEELCGTRPADLVARGVRPELATTIAISASVLCKTMEIVGCERALLVDRGLREGVALLEHAKRQPADEDGAHVVH